jgi:hypothetical protein
MNEWRNIAVFSDVTPLRNEQLHSIMKMEAENSPETLVQYIKYDENWVVFRNVSNLRDM